MYPEDPVVNKESVHTVTHVAFEDIKDHEGNLVRSRQSLANIFNIRQNHILDELQCGAFSGPIVRCMPYVKATGNV